MELAIAIQSFEDIDLIQSPWRHEKLTPVEKETCASFHRVYSNLFGDVSPARVYFGSEFCHYRLTKLEHLLGAYEKVRENGYEFSYVTPYISQNRIDVLENIFRALAEYVRKAEGQKRVEIICNDYGILHYIRENYGDCFQPVLGRLLNKLIRDPRVAEHYDRKDAPEHIKSQFKKASYSVDYYREFLKNLGVSMIEFDNVTQGIEANFENDDFQAAIHLGYGCVATGRTCLVGSMHVKKEEKFRGSVVCRQQCRHYTAELINRHPRIHSMQHRVFQKGNSVFFQQNEEHLKIGLNQAIEKNFQRVIFSPRIPV